MDEKQIDEIELQMLNAGQTVDRNSIIKALRKLHVPENEVVTPNHPSFSKLNSKEKHKARG